MKKLFSVIAAALLVCSLSACADNRQSAPSDGITVVAAMFAEYDFAKQVVGDHGTVKMLMPPGAEIHSYEPTPQDIINIRNADVFIYGGGASDTWLDTVLQSVENSDLVTVSLMDICQLYHEEIVEGMEHNHKHDESCDHGDDEHIHAGHSEYDEHVWTSPLNAVKIIRAITEAVSLIDEENREAYSENSEAYIGRIMALDSEFKSTVANGKRETIVFADRFPFRYFVEEYGLDYFAAFPGCSHDSEPGAKTIRSLIDTINSEGIPVIFTIENSNQNVARAISEETGAKILEFHSCHSVNAEQLNDGITYVELMSRNLKNLKEALN